MTQYKKTIATPQGSVEVPMTPEEIAQRQAEEAANQQMKAAAEEAFQEQEALELKKQMVAVGRSQMLAQYKSAPIELRGLFTSVITRVNGLLDLEDFELAVAEAQAVDTSIVADPVLKEQADNFKAQFVAGLQQLALIGS